MISFTEYINVLQFDTFLQFVLFIGFDLVASFVLVAQSFTDIGFNLITQKFILHDGDWAGVSIIWEPFTWVLYIRALPVQSSDLLQWKERGVRRVQFQA